MIIFAELITRNIPAPQRLYCYVDETGQDTDGGLFVVSVVISDSRREELSAALNAIEQRSGKGRAKWIKVRQKQRSNYITDVLALPLFKGTMFFSPYCGTRAYMATTVIATANAILRAQKSHIPAVVYVDGLPKSRLRWFGVELRHLHIRTDKIVGVRKEESDALIRLADSCCGFVRAALSGENAEMKKLFAKAKASGHLIEV